MNKLDRREVEEKAMEIRSWLEDAVGDMAHSYHDFLDDKWKKKITKAKIDGVQDIKGWLADEYYNDVDTLEDLCGDRIYDAAGELHRKSDLTSDECFVAIAEIMKSISHTALVTALDNLIKRRQK